MPIYSKTRKAAADAVIKEQTFEAIREIVKTHDPQKVGVTIVAQKMGIAPATLYKVFGNKAAMMIHVVLRYFEPFAQEAQAIVESDMPIDKKLHALAVLNLRTICEHNEEITTLYDLCSSSTMWTSNQIRKSREQSRQRIVNLMEEGVRRGVLRKAPALDLALGFMGMIQSFGGHLLWDRQYGSIDGLAHSIVQLFLDGAVPRTRNNKR